MAVYYTTSTAVGNLLGTSFTDSTTPTYQTVATFVAWASDEINEATGQSWTSVSVSQELLNTTFRDRTAVHFTKNSPIISVSTFWANTGSLSDPTWDLKTATTDYAVFDDHIIDLTWTGERGRHVARVSYNHGVSTTPGDIARAAALKAAISVLTAQMNNAAANGLSEFQVGQARFKYGSLDSVISGYSREFDAILKRRGRQLGFVAL